METKECNVSILCYKKSLASSLLIPYTNTQQTRLLNNMAYNIISYMYIYMIQVI